MIFYGSYTSPYARHGRIALLDSSLDWKFVDTDYAASAAGSPSQRVPYLEDGGLLLTDSTSILMHIRGLQQRPFLQSVQQMERYTMVNTAMDSAINLFLLERDGVTPDTTPYLQRQSDRVKTLLAVLDKVDLSGNINEDDSLIRLACFLDWALFRERIDLENLTNLIAFVEQARQWGIFTDTSPDKAA